MFSRFRLRTFVFSYVCVLRLLNKSTMALTEHRYVHTRVWNSLGWNSLQQRRSDNRLTMMYMYSSYKQFLDSSAITTQIFAVIFPNCRVPTLHLPNRWSPVEPAAGTCRNSTYPKCLQGWSNCLTQLDPYRVLIIFLLLFFYLYLYSIQFILFHSVHVYMVIWGNTM